MADKTTTIVIVNASSVLKDADIAAILPAVQKWDNEMLSPAYPEFGACKYEFMTWKQAQPYAELRGFPDNAQPIYVNNHSTDPGALGWHTDESNFIYGRLFAGDCLRYGVSWT